VVRSHDVEAGRHPADDEFVAYYAARADHLRNTAYLLCGDWHFAEDLIQVAVTKLYQAWHHIERHDSLDRYARRVLLRAFLDERRRPWRREYSTMPHNPALDRVAPDSPSTDERMALRSALQRIPTTPGHRCRAVRLLRLSGVLVRGRRSHRHLEAGAAVGVLRLDDEHRLLSAGDRENLLQASIVRDGVPAPGGDLCSTDLADRIDPIFGAGTDCQVVVIDGVTSRNDPDVGATLIAVRFLQGGILGVVSQCRSV
jgi:DNA-directed RNA polymerase specialized sigma24 family protein